MPKVDYQLFLLKLAAGDRDTMTEIKLIGSNTTRDIIAVSLNSGEKQGMYRSSGYNSNMPGKWLPFDGIIGGVWFNKIRFVKYYNPNLPPHLERFGTEELLDISKELEDVAIPALPDKNWRDVNTLLIEAGCKINVFSCTFYL